MICDYSELSKLEYLLSQENINIKSKEFTSDIELKIELTNEQLINLKNQLSRNIKIN